MRTGCAGNIAWQVLILQNHEENNCMQDAPYICYFIQKYL